MSHLHNVADLEWTPEYRPDRPTLARHAIVGEFELDGSGETPDVASQVTEGAIITVWHRALHSVESRALVANIMIKAGRWEARIFSGRSPQEEIQFFDSLVICLNACFDRHLKLYH